MLNKRGGGREALATVIVSGGGVFARRDQLISSSDLLASGAYAPLLTCPKASKFLEALMDYLLLFQVG